MFYVPSTALNTLCRLNLQNNPIKQGQSGSPLPVRKLRLRHAKAPPQGLAPAEGGGQDLNTGSLTLAAVPSAHQAKQGWLGGALSELRHD